MRRIFHFLFMPCEGHTELISASMDRNLSRSERYALRLHLLYCSGCRRFRKQVAQLRRMFECVDKETNHADTLRLSVEARERILLTLRRDAS